MLSWTVGKCSAGDKSSSACTNSCMRISIKSPLSIPHSLSLIVVDDMQPFHVDSHILGHITNLQQTYQRRKVIECQVVHAKAVDMTV